MSECGFVRTKDSKPVNEEEEEEEDDVFAADKAVVVVFLLVVVVVVVVVVVRVKVSDDCVRGCLVLHVSVCEAGCSCVRCLLGVAVHSLGRIVRRAPYLTSDASAISARIHLRCRDHIFW